MDGEKFWDRNPGKFKSLIILVSVLMTAAVIYNFVKYSSTVFSGTTYMQLPSKLYVKKSFTYKTPGGATDTVRAGSFILSIDGKKVQDTAGFGKFLESLSSTSFISLRIFDVKNASRFEENMGNALFKTMSDSITLKSQEFPSDAVRFLTNGSFIGYIYPEGATARAGLKTGDVVLKIKDRDLLMHKHPEADGFDVDFYRYFRSMSKEEPIPYTVLRNGELMAINVIMSTFGISITTLLVFLCGFSYIVMGIYFGLKRPKFIAARLTSIAFLLIGFEISLSLNVGGADFDTYNFIKIYITNLAVIFFLPVLFHSLLYFPEKREAVLNNKWNLRIFYSVAILTFLIFSYLYFFDIQKTDSGIILFLLLGNCIYYTGLRLFYIRKKQTFKKSKVSRKLYLIWLVVFISVFIFPVWRLISGIKLPMWTEYNFLLLFLIPFSYLYFTWRYRLLDIDYKLRRNIQYVALSVFWKVLLTGTFAFLLWKYSMLNLNFPNFRITAGSIELLGVPLDIVTNLFYNKILFIIIAFVSGFVLYKVGKSGQNFFDKKFYMQKFDYKFAQDELVRLFQKKFSIESLANVVVEKISSLVRVKNAGIVFSGDGRIIWDGKCYCFDNTESKLFSFDFEQRSFEAVKGFKGTFSINYLPSEIKEYLESNKFQNVVPIKVNERLLGALFIGEKLSETPLKGEDFEFLSAIVTSTSIAVENAFLYEELTKRERIKHELEIAHNIQVASLPQQVPVVPGLDIHATSIPALEVGGDFYDFLNGTADGLTIVMGDVSGKGTSAALYMSKVQGIFQTLHEFNLSPVKLMTRANHLLYRHIDSKSYITAVGASFDTKNKSLSFARAGHLPLYYFNHNINEIRKIQPSGMGLGLSERNIFDYSIEEVRIDYSEGDIFLFVSDGVPEALNRAGEQFGETKLLEIIKNNSPGDSKRMVNEIMEAVKSFSSDTSQYDDITVVAVKAV